MIVRAALLVLGMALVGLGLPRVDHTRTARSIDNALLFLPDGREMDLAATGQEEALADLLWARAVLTFGERWGADQSAEWVEWMHRMVLVVTELDPHWRTPYFYGSSLMRVLGDVDASDEILRRGFRELPNDPFFPFSLGMNCYVYREDPGCAARWFEVAATKPGAARWVAGAAARMREDAGDRRAAIAYLERSVAEATTEEARADSLWQLGRLRHNDIVDAWTPACRAFAAELGRPPTSAEEFARWAGRPLPSNPRGDEWVVGADGIVRSEAAERERVRRLRQAEWKLAGR